MTKEQSQQFMSMTAFDPRFSRRASAGTSAPDDFRNNILQMFYAQQMAQQMQAAQDGEPIQSTEVPEEVGNPYMGNVFRPSPDVRRLSPLGRFNDMGNRMAAERSSRWADAKQAVADTYAQQDHAMYRDDRGLSVGRDEIPTGGTITSFTSPYGSGEATMGVPNAPIPHGTFGARGMDGAPSEMNYQDWLAQQHQQRYAPAQRPMELGWDDPKILSEIDRITRRFKR